MFLFAADCYNSWHVTSGRSLASECYLHFSTQRKKRKATMYLWQSSDQHRVIHSNCEESSETRKSIFSKNLWKWGKRTYFLQMSAYVLERVTGQLRLLEDMWLLLLLLADGGPCWLPVMVTSNSMLRWSTLNFCTIWCDFSMGSSLRSMHDFSMKSDADWFTPQSVISSTLDWSVKRRKSNCSPQ